MKPIQARSEIPADFSFQKAVRSYQPDFDHQMSSGIYEALVESNRLVPHRGADSGTRAYPPLGHFEQCTAGYGLARFFAYICNSLIIEFVPKEDSQVQKLLTTREDVFPD